MKQKDVKEGHEKAIGNQLLRALKLDDYFNEPWGDIPLNSSTEQGKGWLTSVNFRQAVYIRHVLTHNEMINGVGK